MATTELKQSVREYKRLWEEAGAETSPYWNRAAQRAAVTASAPAAAPTSFSAWLSASGTCPKCRFCDGESPVIQGLGNGEAKLYFVGEKLAGPETQLLAKIAEAMGQSAQTVFTASVLPKGSAGRCFGSFREQIQFVRPKVVVAFGERAASLLGVAMERGRLVALGSSGVLVMPTLHPSQLLATPAAKKTVWEDMKVVLSHLGAP